MDFALSINSRFESQYLTEVDVYWGESRRCIQEKWAYGSVFTQAIPIHVLNDLCWACLLTVLLTLSLLRTEQMFFWEGFFSSVYQQEWINCKAKSRKVRQNIRTPFIISNKDCLMIKYQAPQILVWAGGSYWENVIPWLRCIFFFSRKAFNQKVPGSPSSLAWFHFLLLKE